MMESRLTIVLKALADDTRLRMLNLLQHYDLCVCEIELFLGINQSNASRHLNKLTNAGLLEYYKAAKYVYYKISERSLREYLFLKVILTSGVKKLEPCQSDYEKLLYYKEMGYTCDDLKAGKVKFPVSPDPEINEPHSGQDLK